MAPWSDAVFEDEAIDRLGGNAGRHDRRQFVEAMGGELAGLAHGRKAIRAVQADLAGIPERRRRGVEIGDHDCCRLRLAALAGAAMPSCDIRPLRISRVNTGEAHRRTPPWRTPAETVRRVIIGVRSMTRRKSRNATRLRGGKDAFILARQANSCRSPLSLPPNSLPMPTSVTLSKRSLRTIVRFGWLTMVESGDGPTARSGPGVTGPAKASAMCSRASGIRAPDQQRGASPPVRIAR